MIVGLIVWILVGALAGWLAGQLVAGGGFGFVVNAALGIVGAAVAGLVLPRFGFLGLGLLADVVRGTLGAVVVLLVLSIVPRLR